MKKTFIKGLALLPLASLTTSFVHAEGETTPTFPALQHAYASNYVSDDKGYVSKANLARVVPGIKKRDVYALIGTPHFNEGLFGVRRWNYVLYLYAPEIKHYATCQYQVQFDGHSRVSATYWNTHACENLAKNTD